MGERLNSFNTSLLYSIDSNPKIITYTYIITRFFSNMCFNFFFTIMSYTSWRRVSATVQFEERALAVAFNRSLKMVLGFKYAPSDLLPLLLQSCISVSPLYPLPPFYPTNSSYGWNVTKLPFFWHHLSSASPWHIILNHKIHTLVYVIKIIKIFKKKLFFSATPTLIWVTNIYKKQKTKKKTT